MKDYKNFILTPEEKKRYKEVQNKRKENNIKLDNIDSLIYADNVDLNDRTFSQVQVGIKNLNDAEKKVKDK